MKWGTGYWTRIVCPHRVIIRSWPSQVKFECISKSCSSVRDLQLLLEAWTEATTHWVQLSDAEFAEEERKRADDIRAGILPADKSRKTRSDKGRKRTRTENTRRRPIVSAPTIEDEDDEDEGKGEDEENGDNNDSGHVDAPVAKRRRLERVDGTPSQGAWSISHIITFTNMISEHAAEGDTPRSPASHLVLPSDIMSGRVAESTGRHHAAPPCATDITSNHVAEEIRGHQALPSPNIMLNHAAEESIVSSLWPSADPLCQVRIAPGTHFKPIHLESCLMLQTM
jgi:hypothetical protein